MNKKDKITIEKLEIYNSFRGDVDSFARSANPEQKTGITTPEWYKIDELLSDYHIIKKGLAAEQFEIEFNEKITSSFNGQDVEQKFDEIYNQLKR